MLLHKRVHYSVNVTFTCTAKPKKCVSLTLLWQIYCSDLEPNPQYL